MLFTANNITGSSVTPNANIYYSTSVNSLNQTISAPIRLQGNAFFSNQSTGTNSSIIVNGAISGNASGNFTLALRGNGTAGQSNFINGDISNGNATNLGISTFAGPWTLAGSNSYSGLTTAGGVFTVTGSNSGGGAYTINSGGNFVFNTSGTIVASVVGSQAVSSTRGVTLTGGVVLQVNTDVGAAGSGNDFAPGLTFNNGTLKSGNASGITVDATTVSTTADHKATVQAGGATFDTTIGSINGVTGFFLNGTAAGEITVKGGNTLKAGITNTGLLTIQDSSTWDMNGITSSIAGLSGTNGSVTNTGAAQTLTLNVASGTQTFGGGIGGAANVAVTKIGAGTQVLFGANIYSGATTISVGILQLANANAVQNSTVTISATNGLAFSTGIGTFNLGGLSGASNQSLADTAASAVTLSVGANNASTTYSGALSGVGGVSKVGNGSLSLSGANSYSGDTTIGSGTLSIGGTGQIGGGNYAGNISIANSAVFEHASSAYTTVGGAANRITGLGSITKSGAGTLRIDSSQSFSGGVNLTQGNLEYNGAGAFGTGTITASAGEITGRGAGGSLANDVVLNGNVQFGRSGVGSSMSFAGDFDLGGGTRTITTPGVDVTISGDITNGGLTKAGDSKLTLSGTNAYIGATSVNAGKLLVSGSIANSAVTVTGANTTLASGSTGTIGSSVTVSNGAILAAGDTNSIGSATVGSGGTTLNSSSIFSWDLNVTTPANTASTTTYDKLVTSSLGGDDSAVFAVVLAGGQSFDDAFWTTNHSWDNVFSTNGLAAGALGMSSVFSSFTYNGSGSAPVSGAFTFTGTGGSTLTWSAVPEPSTAFAGLLVAAGFLRRRRH
jgi:autotransporter-associated beta strand protein